MPEITEKHKEFARAVVALAREHGANNLNVAFDFGSSQKFLAGEYGDLKTHFSWKEGRHGASERITLSASETVFMKEQIED